MKSFINILLGEAKTGKNLHLEHIEDEVLNGGVDGTRGSINFIQSLRDMLAGSSMKNTYITTKWDGAPAVFCGINPENDKFFVGSKSIFNKTPKINYTPQDIDDNHPPGLASKLKVALEHLPKLGIKGVLQGDMMFAKEDLAIKTIEGERYVTFHPNTIVYAVPLGSDLGKEILNSKMGIVFHTEYKGTKLEDMKSSFNININRLLKNKDIWFRDAEFTDASGTASFTARDTETITKILSSVGRTFQNISANTLNTIADDSEINTIIKTFNNSKIKTGQQIRNIRTHVTQLIRYIENKYDKDINKLKTDAAKDKKTQRKNEFLKFFLQKKADLEKIFDLMNMLIDAKMMIISKLENMEQLTQTFVKDGAGYKVTAPEGFVAVDQIKGGAVKLVDRLEFSRNNFNVELKNWS
tara:strand:- start:366 stop:1598 length:1233 start_codon:yes stop_codon:yes gene_type:complete